MELRTTGHVRIDIALCNVKSGITSNSHDTNFFTRLIYCIQAPRVAEIKGSLYIRVIINGKNLL